MGGFKISFRNELEIRLSRKHRMKVYLLPFSGRHRWNSTCQFFGSLGIHHPKNPDPSIHWRVHPKFHCDLLSKNHGANGVSCEGYSKIPKKSPGPNKKNTTHSSTLGLILVSAISTHEARVGSCGNFGKLYQSSTPMEKSSTSPWNL